MRFFTRQKQKRSDLGRTSILVTASLRRRKWRKEHREEWLLRARAHNAVHYALKVGKLRRKPCEECGTKHRVQAHHDDPLKKLDVRWLCTGCHSKVDGTAARNRAKTHCKRGHLLAGENLKNRPNGKRDCRACQNQ